MKSILKFHPIRRLLVQGLVLAALCGANARARAADELRLELQKVAEGISAAMKGMGEDTISVGQFTGPAQLNSSAGPAFTKILGEELTKLGLTVKPRSKLGVKGEYVDITDAKTKKLAAQIKGEVTDRGGKVCFTFVRGVFGTATLAALFGVSAELPAESSETQRDQKLKDSLDNPAIVINESKVSATANSPYIVEILLKNGNDYLPRPAVEDEGQAFVKIGRDEIYGIRLTNNSPLDAAVTLTIDGLSVFAFSEYKDYTHMILPAGKSGLVLGWHRSNEVSDAFQVTEYSKSAVAQSLPNSGTVGTITAAFAAAWPANQDPPADEPPGPKGGRSADATGRGPEVANKYTEVVRTTGVVRAAVSIRYTKPDPADLPPAN